MQLLAFRMPVLLSLLTMLVTLHPLSGTLAPRHGTSCVLRGFSTTENSEVTCCPIRHITRSARDIKERTPLFQAPEHTPLRSSTLHRKLPRMLLAERLRARCEHFHLHPCLHTTISVRVSSWHVSGTLYEGHPGRHKELTQRTESGQNPLPCFLPLYADITFDQEGSVTPSLRASDIREALKPPGLMLSPWSEIITCGP